MVKLYITRHGETQWNREKRMQGWKDSDLTPAGEEDARALAQVLKRVSFEAVYSSPIGRARKTAELLVDQAPIILEEDLREIGMGDWEGRTQEEVRAADPERFHTFWNKPHVYETETGETFNQVMDRVESFLKKVQVHQGTILVVTHSIFIKALLAYVKELPLDKLWSPPFIEATSLTVIEGAGGSMKLWWKEILRIKSKKIETFYRLNRIS
ncbi:histidine phosphatase family protein [Rossellomorea marisflavi]|uniref:histidine phosphatase family protein n=1 Tax=Rossellomorea marisflavi TaxID=189381 RepID=UPI001315B5CB|nr:histidine phosphatase family protein [Rossellomorea marisflavi]QHA35515.1 histidine phosphatase family protein [Rossellomorea marisflavi]